MTPTIDQLVPLVAGLLVLCIGGVVTVRLLLPRVIAMQAKRKLPVTERSTFAYKRELLEHEDLVELYAPSKHFMKEIEREQKPRQQAPWLSAYPRAVKHANKRHRPSKASKRVLQARKQIAEAAKYVSVTELPEELQPGNAGSEHFFITLQFKGNPEAKVRTLEGAIKSQLGLHSLIQTDAEDYYSIRYIGHAVAPQDRLELHKVGADFFEDYPAQRVTSIPLAMKADGTPWSLPTHHTLIHGTTGSGKGSPIQGIVRQLEPFIIEGTVELHGIDPKNGELPGYADSSLFKTLALADKGAMFAAVGDMFRLMKDRQANVKRSVANDFGRKIPITKDTPLVLFIIDELFMLLTAMKNGGKPGALAMEELSGILAMGRSANVFVITATQDANKELMGAMRDNFPNKIVLRLEVGNEYWNDMWLGNGAAARGFDALAIAPSNEDNNYATAGIGFVKQETGAPVKVRFVHTSPEDLAALLERNPGAPDKGSRPATAAPLVAAATHPDTDQDDDGDFTMEEDGLPVQEGFNAPRAKAMPLPKGMANDEDNLALPALD